MQFDVFIELLPEDPLHKGGRDVGKLHEAMYGTRDAPQIWQDTVESHLRDLGFAVSVLHTAVYDHHERDIRVMVRVDDFSARTRRSTWIGCARPWAMSTS